MEERKNAGVKLILLAKDEGAEEWIRMLDTVDFVKNIVRASLDSKQLPSCLPRCFPTAVYRQASLGAAPFSLWYYCYVHVFLQEREQYTYRNLFSIQSFRKRLLTVPLTYGRG